MIYEYEYISFLIETEPTHSNSHMKCNWNQMKQQTQRYQHKIFTLQQHKHDLHKPKKGITTFGSFFKEFMNQMNFQHYK